MRFALSFRKVGLLSLLGLATIGLTAYFLNNPEHASSISCGTGYNVMVSGASSSNATNVSGNVSVTFTTPTGNTQTISRVIFRANGRPIGRAQPVSSYQWSMPWVTTLFPSGIAHMDAEIVMGGSTTPCTVNGYDVNIINATQTKLTATISPNTWEGPMSFSFPVNVSPTTHLATFDITPFALYNWSTNIGNITGSGRTAQFFSGQTIGTGVVNAKVSYGGGEFVAKLNVSVKGPDAPLPKTTTTEGSTATDDKTEEEEKVAQSATLQNNPAAQDCIVTAIGKARYDAINSGTVRPTLEEISKFNACFANSNYILPSNFAPVAPTAIKELGKNTELQVNAPKNETKSDKEVLTLSGKAKPNSLVIIYVFSDPLVLTTTANENGEWTYVLEDPIEPGDHEVYSVVDRGDGVYERSDPFSFAIATAEAAEANPDGLSLRLADSPTPSQSKRSLILYAGSTAAVLALVITVLIVLIRRRSRTAPQVSMIAPQQSAPAVPPAENNPQDGQK